jgi:hypothetical protein
MKLKTGFAFFVVLLISCSTNKSNQAAPPIPLIGTWKLLSGTLIEKGDTTVTKYDRNLSFIKIINDTHFAFLQHDQGNGEDSTAIFVAGGGRYSLADSLYTEHLEYCSAREWENHDFVFTVSIQNDTLVQRGIEKVESANINRINIERYVRIKDND